MRFHSSLPLLLAPWLTLPVSLTSAAPLAFRAVDVDTRIEIGYGVAVADVNGDQKPDIVLADKNFYVWYENPGWQKHVLAEKLTPLDHVCVAARDLDGDGRCEIAVGAGWNPSDTVNSGAVFYLNAPASRTERWSAQALPHEPTVHRMRWVKTAAGVDQLIMLPLHGRGNKTTGEGAGVTILAYQKSPDAPGGWKPEKIQTALHKTHNLDPVQWDADPEDELLVASLEGVFVIDRSGGTPRFTQLTGTESGGAGEVRLGKLAGGRRFLATVEPMHGTNLVAYTPSNRPGETTLWDRQVVDSTLVDGHALACGDLAGIGRDQVVVGWRAMGKTGARVGIKLFTPEISGRQWSPTLVDDNQMACEDLCLADLNGDGRLDIVAAGRATKNVKVYFNEAPRP
jgi:hypothetical protein